MDGGRLRAGVKACELRRLGFPLGLGREVEEEVWEGEEGEGEVEVEGWEVGRVQ